MRNARVESLEQLLHAGEIAGRQQGVQPIHPPIDLPFRLRHHRLQEAVVQALAYLPVRIAQAIVRSPATPLGAVDREVAGLEQQRFRLDAMHVERRQQLLAPHRVFEVQCGHSAPEQRRDQEGRRAGLEPPRPELPVAEQQQHVEGVVHPLLAPPVVAVVPLADRLPVEARKLGGEHLVQVRVGVAAQGRVARVQGDVDEVVEVGEQADLGELADPGKQGELHVRIAELEVGVQPAQGVAVVFGKVRRVERIQDRLVVLVHEHHHPLPAALVQGPEQVSETPRRGVVAALDRNRPFDGVQLLHQVRAQAARFPEALPTEVQPYHRMAHRPVPVLVDGKSLEELLAAFEQLLQGIQEQALAEPARARQKVVLAVVDQPQGVGCLVDVVAALLADLAEGLDADGQALLHGCTISRSVAKSTSERARLRHANSRKLALNWGSSWSAL